MNKMLKCAECNRKESVLFGCCLCRKAYCANHVNPETHRCVRLSMLKYWFRTKEVSIDGKPTKKFFLSILTFCIILTIGGMFAVQTYCLGNIELEDPNYLEVLNFIEKDQTNKNLYRYEEYICHNFATDFKKNAIRAGFRCGYVQVFFPDCSHALNCFNTTDYGLIFVEPQKDELVSLTVGLPYWNRTNHTVEIYGERYNDTITGFFIEW